MTSPRVLSATVITVIAASSAGRIGIGTVVAGVGLVTLLFNRRWAEALVAGQREALGALLPARLRRLSNRIHSAELFVVVVRIFTALISLAFIAAGLTVIITS